MKHADVVEEQNLEFDFSPKFPTFGDESFQIAYFSVIRFGDWKRLFTHE